MWISHTAIYTLNPMQKILSRSYTLPEIMKYHALPADNQGMESYDGMMEDT